MVPVMFCLVFVSMLSTSSLLSASAACLTSMDEIITGFTIIDADLGTPIDSLAPNAAMNYATLPTTNLNVRVEYNSASSCPTTAPNFIVDSVQTEYYYNTSYHRNSDVGAITASTTNHNNEESSSFRLSCERFTPYSIFGDNNPSGLDLGSVGPFNPFTFPVSDTVDHNIMSHDSKDGDIVEIKHTIIATPFTGPECNGEMGRSYQVDFNVINTSPCPSGKVLSLVLWDADTLKPEKILLDGDTICPVTTNYNIEARVVPCHPYHQQEGQTGGIGEVRLTLFNETDDAGNVLISRSEKQTKYFLLGDYDNNINGGGVLQDGQYVLEATPFGSDPAPSIRSIDNMGGEGGLKIKFTVSCGGDTDPTGTPSSATTQPPQHTTSAMPTIMTGSPSTTPSFPGESSIPTASSDNTSTPTLTTMAPSIVPTTAVPTRTTTSNPTVITTATPISQTIQPSLSPSKTPSVTAVLSIQNNSTAFTLDMPIDVTLSLENLSTRPIRFLYWMAPFNVFGSEYNQFDMQSPLFSVTRDGDEQVAYTGIRAARLAPTDYDYIVFKPGGKLVVTLDLTRFYDFSLPGRYEIFYFAESVNLFAPNRGTTTASSVTSVPIVIDVTAGRRAIKSLHRVGGRSLRFLEGTCSPEQLAELEEIKEEAFSCADSSLSYLESMDPEDVNPVYEDWFGDDTNEEIVSMVTENFRRIRDALLEVERDITYDCTTCNDGDFWCAHCENLTKAENETNVAPPDWCEKDCSNGPSSFFTTVIAFVYSNRNDNKVFLCDSFFAWYRRRSTQVGTIIHELSHFDNIAATNDIVYGEQGSEQLIDEESVLNADNYGYFCNDVDRQTRYSLIRLLGDPWLTLFGGFRLACQGQGIFNLLQSKNSSFTIQSSFAQVGTDGSASVITGTAIRNEGNVVQVSIASNPDSEAIVFNDCPVQIYNNGTLLSNATRDIFHEEQILQGWVTADRNVFILLLSTLAIRIWYPVSRLYVDMWIDFIPTFGCFISNQEVLFPIAYGIPWREGHLNDEALFGLLGDPYSLNRFFSSDGETLQLESTSPEATTQYCKKEFCIRDESQSIMAYEDGVSVVSAADCDAPYMAVDLSGAEQNLRQLCGEDTLCLTDGVVGGIEAAELSIAAQLDGDMIGASVGVMTFQPAFVGVFEKVEVSVSLTSISTTDVNLEGYAIYRISSEQAYDTNETNPVHANSSNPSILTAESADTSLFTGSMVIESTFVGEVFAVQAIPIIDGAEEMSSSLSQIAWTAVRSYSDVLIDRTDEPTFSPTVSLAPSTTPSGSPTQTPISFNICTQIDEVEQDPLELDFNANGAPILENGTMATKGAVFRYRNVSIGIDAIVTIVDISFQSLQWLLGDDGGNGILGGVLAGVPDAFFEFQVDLVNANTTIPIQPRDLFVLSFNIDSGISGQTDFAEYVKPDEVFLNEPTKLQNSFDGNRVRFTTNSGIGTNDFSDLEFAAGAIYLDVSSFTVRGGLQNASFQRFRYIAFEVRRPTEFLISCV